MAGQIVSDEEEFSEGASDFENYSEKENQTAITKKVSYFVFVTNTCKTYTYILIFLMI